MKKVFVSGTYNLLHAGHIEFFKQAKALGDYLIVSFCSDANLLKYKGYRSSMPEDNKRVLLEAIRYVDRVYMGTDDGGVFDFVPAFLQENPDILAITTDDKAAQLKREFCEKHGCELVVLDKTNPVTQVSSFDVFKNLTKGD